MGRKTRTLALALGVLVVVWALANLAFAPEGFAIQVSPKLRGGEEAASALARLFAALVLGLFLVEDVGRRMYWVAGGLVILGLGHLIFGYVEPAIQNDPPELSEALYESFVTRTFACALFAVGMLPKAPPRLVAWTAVAVPSALVAGYVIIFEFIPEDANPMPAQSVIESSEGVAELGRSPFEWLTAWYWALSALPLALTVGAAVGAYGLARRGLLPGWLLISMVLLAGAILHEYLWPSFYGGEVLTTADLLGLAFALAIALGGVFELRRAAAERAALLASERERVRRLDELSELRAGFSAMVAHELSSPLAAIRRLTEMLRVPDLDHDARSEALDYVERETNALDALVADVRSAARTERDDFRVEACPVPLSDLVEGAAAFARTLPGDHPLKVCVADGIADEEVLADRERVGQVLRNLLSNAARYSPEGSPVELRATRRAAGRVRLEVADEGPGIHPDDLRRVFEKFGRGRDPHGRRVPGVGLGLYLSRRIVRAHGSELTVRSAPGEGSVFSFELEEVAR